MRTPHAPIFVALFVTALGFAGCGGTEDGLSCPDDCNTLAPSVCEGDRLRTFSGAGQCIDGQCIRVSDTAMCEWGCADGACLTEFDVCGAFCDQNTPARCDGDVVVQAAASFCDAELGACTSNPERIDCGAVGQTCAIQEGRPTCVGSSPPTCDDGALNGDETDVDCGGPVCPACDLDASCGEDGDCVNENCIEGVCRTPTCDDARANGEESDVDCGGACAPCATGQACLGDLDCEERSCEEGVCAAASCEDGQTNGDETDLDCGGTCGPCRDGYTCEIDTDCTSLQCVESTCAPATCVDGLLNGAESDVDCGGDCLSCAVGAGCNSGEDCVDGVCGADGLCAAGTCDDGVQNAGEIDVDCGADCGLCDDGQRCLEDAQCASSRCIDNVCASECDDSLLNGDETDVDCGGSCAPCADDARCVADTDCASLSCEAGRCEASRCTDGMQNGAETDVDCGGACAGCELGEGCVAPRDCASLSCVAGVCIEPTCDDGVANGSESDVDCGGACPDACSLGDACLGELDCAEGRCVLGVCRVTCDDEVRNGRETDVDCGGDCIGCAPTEKCTEASDCLSLVCVGAPGTNRNCVDGCGEGTCDDDGFCIGVCAAPTCDDGEQNQGELDVDCGGECPGAPCAVECEDPDVSVDLNTFPDGEGVWRIPRAGESAPRFPTTEGRYFPRSGTCFDFDRGDGPEVMHRFAPEEAGMYRMTSLVEEVGSSAPSVVFVLERECSLSAFELDCADASFDRLGSTLEVELEAGNVYFIGVDADFTDGAGAAYGLLVEGPIL